MVWSKWRGTLVALVGCAGLAWSQVPESTPSDLPVERIMTVHENGKSTRCKIVNTWKTNEGAKAWQLQNMETGEMVTIVASGTSSTVVEPNAGKATAQPMRIFHWGRNPASPAGAPTPPVVTAAVTTVDKAPAPTSSHVTQVSKNDIVPVPLTENKAPVSTRTVGKEQIIWWEERNGQRVSPMILTEGKNPFEQSTGFAAPGQTSTAPVLVEKTIQDASPVKITATDEATKSPAAPTIVSQTPYPASTIPGSMQTPRMGTTPPSVRTVTQIDAGATKATIINDGSAPPATTSEKSPSLFHKLFSRKKDTDAVNADKAVSGTTQAPIAPPAMTGALQPLAPTSPTGPASVLAADASNYQATPANAGPTNAAIINNGKPATGTGDQPKTFSEKFQNWLRPKRDTAKSGDAKDTAKDDKTKPNAPPVARVSSDRVPFSTAADPSATGRNLPAPAPPTPSDVAASAPPPGPATVPATLPPPPTLPQAQTAPQKNWRTMWGQTNDGRTQVPGQSMVEQASTKPDPNSIPALQYPPGMPSALPPTSQLDKQRDILLNPESFDPSNARLTPRGINMNSYRGDPALLMTTNDAPGNPNQAGAMSPPAGAQSVIAAANNAPGRTTYVPVPVATVPDPYRVPMPPAANVPAPPQPNAYVNAFTPPPAPPQDNQAQNQGPMNVNAFSNMAPPPNQTAQRPVQMPPQAPGYPPATYQPNPMAQGYPVTPGYPPNPNVMIAQGTPNPYYYAPQGQMPQSPMMPQQAMVPQQPMVSPQGYPVAQVNFPQNYQGPQAPNPALVLNQAPVQPTQYNQVPMQQPAMNMAMDRRQMPSANSNQTADLANLLQVLRESPYPAQREWASNTLATYDWRAHPEILQSLMLVAQQDPAATVRASCVYSIGRLNAASEPVVSVLYTLRNDGDPRVRQEVEQALVRLGASKQ